MEGIMEDKLQSGLLLLHHSSNFLIESGEDIKIGTPPRFVHGLNSYKALMIAPSVKESLDCVLSPVEVVLVDVNVLACIIVPFTHPLAESLVRVLEVVFIGPCGSIG